MRLLSEVLVTFCTADSPMRQICELVYPRVRQIIWHKPMGSQYSGSSESRLWFAHEVILHAYNRATWAKPKTLALASAIQKAREAAGLSRGAVDMVVRGTKTGLCYRWEEAACLPTPQQVKTLKTIMELGPDFEDALRQATADKAETADKADVLSHRTVTNGVHPTSKPLALMYNLVQTIGSDAQTILDPFMGSGTTLRAAKDLGCKAIGIEIEEKYCEIAAKRMSQSAMELSTS